MLKSVDVTRTLCWAHARCPMQSLTTTPTVHARYLDDLRHTRSMSRGVYGVAVLPLNVRRKFVRWPVADAVI